MNEQMHEWMGCMSGTILSFQNSGFLSLMQISFGIIICIIHWPRATSLVFDNDDEDLPTLSDKHNNNNNWMLYFEKALTSIIAFYSVSTLIKGRAIIFILQMEKKLRLRKEIQFFQFCKPMAYLEFLEETLFQLFFPFLRNLASWFRDLAKCHHCQWSPVFILSDICSTLRGK